MFGEHGRRREQKKLFAERTKLAAQNRQNQADKEAQRQTQQDVDSIEDRVRKSAEHRKQAQKEGQQRSQELFNRDVEGIPAKKREAMQYEANKQIQRDLQSANRRLLGEQGQRGIVGRGGVGYAQQRDLQKIASEMRGQSLRDLEKLDSDVAAKNRAAQFTVEQGEASQAQLDRQLAIDEMRYEQERKRQRELEDRFYRQFSRI